MTVERRSEIEKQKEMLRGQASALWGMLGGSFPAIAGEITGAFLALPCLAEADAVLLYAAMPGELPTAGIDAGVRARGIPVGYPRCDKSTHTMQFHLAAPEALSPGCYGIPEPEDSAPLLFPTARTVAVVPGLAFGRNGSRLGRGGGYYDRFLARFPGVSVGIIPQELLFGSVPEGAYDLPVSVILTGKEVLVFDR